MKCCDEPSIIGIYWKILGKWRLNIVSSILLYWSLYTFKLIRNIQKHEWKKNVWLSKCKEAVDYNKWAQNAWFGWARAKRLIQTNQQSRNQATKTSFFFFCHFWKKGSCGSGHVDHSGHDLRSLRDLKSIWPWSCQMNGWPCKKSGP